MLVDNLTAIAFNEGNPSVVNLNTTAYKYGV